MRSRSFSVLVLLVSPCLYSAVELKSARFEDLPWLTALPSIQGRGDGGGADVVGPLRVIQTAYSDPVNGNVALLIWEENTSNPNGVNVYVDGVLIGTLPAPGLFFATELEAGARAFKVEESGVSSPSSAEGALMILGSQPFDDVTDFRCGRTVKEDGETCRLEVSWTNAAILPSYYLILLDESRTERTEGSNLESYKLSGVEPGSHSVGVFGFLEADSGDSNDLYRGRLIETTCSVSDCKPNGFVRGSCDGASSNLQITSAVFALNYLFLGGKTPPCLAACDANADGRFVLSDPVYVLNFLFIGGPPPVGWTESGEATCESATADKCAEFHGACS